MRVFLDANVLFSAARQQGAMFELLHLIAEFGGSCHADPYVVEEARRNLIVKHPERVAALEELLAAVEVAASPTLGSTPAGVVLEEKDVPVLLAAIAARCDVLVTGDRTHFGQLFGATVHGVEVLAPAELARRLLGS